MPPDFLPLRLPDPDATNPGFVSLRVLQAPSAQPAFTPITKSHLSSCTSPSQSTPPQISLQRDGDHVTGIRIQCSCGQIIELACEF